MYFMDGESLEDVIDLWNLRATGRPVLPLPKQFSSTPQFERLITDYLKEHRVHWRHDPKVCELAHFIRSRHSTMDEMQAYAKTLKLEIPKGDTSTDGFFALQHWYLASGTSGRATKTTPCRATPTPSRKLQSTLKTRRSSAFASSRYSQRSRTRTASTVKGVAPMTLNSGSTAPASPSPKSFLSRPARISNAPFRDWAHGGTGASAGTDSSRLSPMT